MIESLEVIKGPAAATLYGTEAANGVDLSPNLTPGPIMLTIGQPLVAQMTPCFTKCHSAAMEREEEGMEWEENNEEFLECIEDEC